MQNLPLTDPTGGQNFWLVVAQAKALGVIPNDNNVDGTFTFASGSSYTYDPQNRQVAGKFDFIAVAQHELTEIMGRASELGTVINSSGLGECSRVHSLRPLPLHGPRCPQSHHRRRLLLH